MQQKRADFSFASHHELEHSDVLQVRERFRSADEAVERFLAAFTGRRLDRIANEVRWQEDPWGTTPLWLLTHTETHGFITRVRSYRWRGASATSRLARIWNRRSCETVRLEPPPGVTAPAPIWIITAPYPGTGVRPCMMKWSIMSISFSSSQAKSGAKK